MPSVNGSKFDLFACPGIIPWHVSLCYSSDADVRRYSMYSKDATVTLLEFSLKARIGRKRFVVDLSAE